MIKRCAFFLGFAGLAFFLAACGTTGRQRIPRYSVDVFGIHPDDFYFISKQYPDGRQSRNEMPANVNISFEATKRCYADLKALALEDGETTYFFTINELTAYMETILEATSMSVLRFQHRHFPPGSVVEQVRSVGNFIAQSAEPSNRPDTDELYSIYYFERL
jgi:hypothetical protein